MLYETQADRGREASILREYGARRNLRVERAPLHFSYDAVAYHKDRVVEVIEVKYRNISRTKHSTYHIDKHKIDKLRKAARKMGAVAVLIVSWQGDIGWVTIDRYVKNGRLTLTTGVTQRGDRVENPDEVYYIPIAGFTGGTR